MAMFNRLYEVKNLKNQRIICVCLFNRAFRTFARFVLVWICRFPLPLGVWEGLRFVIVALPGLFCYLFFFAGFMRSSELSNIKVSDCVFDSNYMTIFVESSKTGKYRDDSWI